jgi:hypothetical protein
MGRWVGTNDAGQAVGYVGEIVTGGGTEHHWHAWLNDGTPGGVEVGEFASAEAAMAAFTEYDHP